MNFQLAIYYFVSYNVFIICGIQAQYCDIAFINTQKTQIL